MKNNQNNNIRVRTTISVVAVAMLALGGFTVGELGTQTAMAADNKVISGHACAPEGDDIDTDRSDPRYLESLSSNQTYMCPVVRDDTTGELDFVRVRLENGGNAADDAPECTVHAVSVSGGSIDSETEVGSSALGVDTLAFSLNGFTEFNHGHYVIECLLQDRDRIISYRTNED